MWLTTLLKTIKESSTLAIVNATVVAPAVTIGSLAVINQSGNEKDILKKISSDIKVCRDSSECNKGLSASSIHRDRAKETIKELVNSDSDNAVIKPERPNVIAAQEIINQKIFNSDLSNVFDNKIIIIKEADAKFVFLRPQASIALKEKAISSLAESKAKYSRANGNLGALNFENINKVNQNLVNSIKSTVTSIPNAINQAANNISNDSSRAPASVGANSSAAINSSSIVSSDSKAALSKVETPSSIASIVTDIGLPSSLTIASSGSGSSVSVANPSELSSLALVSNLGSSIDISWANGGGTTSGFKLAFSFTGVAPADCSTASDLGLVTSKSIASLNEGQAYSMRICAYNSNGDLSAGQSLTVTTNIVSQASPTEVSNLAISQNNGSNVVLGYDVASGTTAGFKYASASGATAPDANACQSGADLGNVSSITLGSLSEGQQYSVRVCAYNGNTSASYSNGSTLSFTTNIVSQATSNNVSGLAATSDSSSVSLSWSNGGGTTAGYKVAYASGLTAPSDCTQGTIIDNGTNTSYTLSGLASASDYSFRVCSYNGNTTPSLSSGVSVSQATAAVVITVTHNGWNDIFAVGPRYNGTVVSNEVGYVASSSRCNGTAACVRLGWNAFTVSGGTHNSYNIYRGTSAGSLSFLANVPSSQNYYIDSYGSGLVLGSNVYYEVKAVVNSVVQPNSSNDQVVEVPYPDYNVALIHRWMANRDMCLSLGKTPDRSNNYRCTYNGVGNTSGYYDFASHLLTDRFGHSTANNNYVGATLKTSNQFNDLNVQCTQKQFKYQGAGFTARALTYQEYLAMSSWDTNHTNYNTGAKISNIESTTCMGEFTLMADAAKDACTSKYGVQNIVGNYPIMVSDSISTTNIVSSNDSFLNNLTSGVLNPPSTVTSANTYTYFNPIIGLPVTCSSGCGSDDNLILTSSLNLGASNAGVSAVWDSNFSRNLTVGKTLNGLYAGRFIAEFTKHQNETTVVSTRCVYKVP